MKKKTSGIDDLIKTLVKQHGLTKAIDAAREQVHTLEPTKQWERTSIWRVALHRMKEMR